MSPLDFDPQQQRTFAVDVVRRLREQSFEAYWAGGCVRDQLLGQTPKDYDVATSARPEEIRAVFGARRTVPVGEAFGVVRVLGPKSAGPIEVATFRQDVAYSDGRHPDAVQFSTPEADAQRRDFTVNGMFYDPLADRVIDFVGGQDDLVRQVLRAIGEPRARFAEDKLRLLRAVRFTAALDFTLDPATRGALEAMAGEINIVSVERIAIELRLMLVCPQRVRAVILLHETGLLSAVLPELSLLDRDEPLTATGRDSQDAWVVTLDALATLVDPSFALALAVLLHAFVDGAGGEAVGRRLKLPTREWRRVRWLIDEQSALVDAPHAAWPKLQRLLTTEGSEELVALHEALALAAGRDTAHVAYCRARLALPPAELNPPPLMTGDDLIAHGVPRGKHYQRLLDAVRDAQLEGRVANRTAALALVDDLLKQDLSHPSEAD
ncbi:MAG: CCA tRNA nucleotidyltransferase [Pirellulales bacterium]